MSKQRITTRLREIMRVSHEIGESVNGEWVPCVDAPAERFNGECDMIDGAYATLEALYETACAVNDKQDVQYTQLKRERDSALAELERVQSEEVNLSDYLLLPKDAGNERVHVGDWMQRGGDRFKVVAIDGDGWLWYLGDATSGWRMARARECLHCHTPTVEDVLREMHAELDEVTALYVGEVIDSDERDRDEARIFAEYAKKLRLAGDA